jgi:hypothetical protein
MTGFEKHPSWAELNRLADGELSGDRRRRVATHSAACSRCRETVSYLSAVREAAGEIRHPSPPRDLLNDVIESRQAGQRVILPAAAVDLPKTRRAPAAAAGLALALAGGLATVLAVSEAGAGSSDLTFDPRVPRVGEAIEVTYRAGSLLAGQDRLRLRVRARKADATTPRATMGRYVELDLHPRGDGEYTTTLDLSADVAYATFSVEDPTGTLLDDRGGRLWDLLSHDSRGQPLLEALRQQFLVLEMRDWPAAGEGLEQMTYLYPDRAEGWSRQLAHEKPILLPDEAAASAAKHREIFRDLQDRALALGTPPPEEIASLTRYAMALSEEEAAAYWLDRLEAVEPLHPLALSARLLIEAGRGDLEALDFLEEVWTSSGARSAVVYRGGLAYASRIGDPEAVRRWALRGLPLTSDHEWAVQASLAMVAHPETREQGIAEVKRLIAHLAEPDEAERPLHLTRQEAQRQSTRLIRKLQARFGAGLLASGDVKAALRAFDGAESLGGWQPDLYRWRAEALLAAGDTEAALMDLARLEADPLLSRDSIGSLIESLPPRLDGAVASRRPQAVREMIDRLRAELPTPRSVPHGELVDASGIARGLEDVLDNRPAVLFFWDRRVLDSEAGSVVVADRHLVDAGLQLLWATPEPHSEVLRAFVRGAGLTVIPYHDPGAALAAEVGEWGAMGCYVIDRAGRIRARTDNLMEAVRLLEVLEMETRAAA